MANIKKPKDDNIDNIIREFVNVQDETCPEEYTNEVDKILKTLTGLRTDEITTMMPAHRLVEWNKYVTGLEHLTTSCFENIQRAASSNEPNIHVTRSTDAIPKSHSMADSVGLPLEAGPPPLEDPNSPEYDCVECHSANPLCMECHEMSQLKM